MGFKGPGVYEIVSYQGPTFNANSWGGGTQLGQQVKLYPRSPLSDNAKWQVSLASGSGDDAQYYITNLANGGYLTATTKNQITSCQFKNPTDQAVLWKLKYYKKQDKYDVWTVTSVSGNGQLNCSGSSHSEGTEILSWQIENGDNTMWYFDPVGW